MTNVASCLANVSKQEDGSSSCSTRRLSHVMQRPVVTGSRSGLGMKGDVSQHHHQVAHMLKIPNILIANEIPTWISRGTPGYSVSLRGRPPAGRFLCRSGIECWKGTDAAQRASYLSLDHAAKYQRCHVD